MLGTVGLLVLAVFTVGLCYLAITHDEDTPVTAEESSGSNAGGGAAGSESASADPNAPPEIADQVRADFTASPDLPPGARTYDNPATGGPLQVNEAGLSHAPPKAPIAIGSLEVQLAAPVRKLGATIGFPEGNAGSVGLIAWTSSLVDARTADQPVPTSGLRLVVTPSDWELTVYDGGEFVIGGDDYEPVDGPVTFEVYRSENTVWVVDPAGTVTRTEDPLVGELAGPWACWQLIEDNPQQTPARIQALWAG